jgi:hypothetical protein
LERFLLNRYAEIGEKLLDINANGQQRVVAHVAQATYGSVLFYMRTGLRHLSEPVKFSAFMLKLNEETAD